jgi:DNA mismatch repair protein MutS
MNYTKEILVSDYFEIHNYYSEKYGKKRTIVLMQVGSFHECYCTDTDGLDLVLLAQSLDVVCTKKNGSLPLSKSNPRMLGFPIFVTNTFIDKLVDMNYTVIKIDQVSEPPKPKREVTGIFSPATHIESKNNKSFYLVSIVLDKIKSNNNNFQLCIALSAYDLSTGKGSVYETYSTCNDVLLGLDDALRFLDNYPPREIVLENNLTNEDLIACMKVEEILAYLNIDINSTYNINITNHKKLSFQKNLLNSIYKIESNIDIIEILGLNFLNYARLSLVLLLDYAQSHQPKLLENLQKPEIFSSTKFLYLGNRALEQLDVFNKGMDTNLFNIINNTKTAIGKRYLQSMLTNPLIDNNELNERYNIINNIIVNNDLRNNITNYMEDIYDLDKIIRKLEINIINPYELYQLYISFYQINKLFEYLETEKLLQVFDIKTDIIKTTKKLIKVINTRFIVDSIKDINFNNFTETNISFYNKSYNKDIDSLQEQINDATNFMTLLVKSLEGHIKYTEPGSESQDKSLITLKFNERDGHYLLITNKRCELLRKNLAKITKIKVGSIELNTNDLEFNELPKSSSTKINCKKIKEISLDLVLYKNKMAKKLKEIFKEDMILLKNEFGIMLHNASNKIAYIDFLNSGAIGAISNHYCRPNIIMKNDSYFNAKELRHPIVEKISNDTVYVSHNIALGCMEEQDGILLYGINSSGKSTLMKSIGLNIILAQIGYYVAAKSFTFCPYTSLFTRINCNDNMFRGLSSFMVEMMELMAILKRNNNHTLVVADEIASGTELRSATVIICYMLETLANSKSSFITATHLHDINNISTVKNLDRIRTKHLKITYDHNNDMLIYNRFLLDGQGDTFYGLQVAKYLMKDKIFNDRTNDILKEYDNISTITSKYNKDVYLEKCEICESKNKLETHHITWQKEFDDNDININKFHLQKNDPSNLVVLCMECHDKVDRKEININGWVETSNGRIFDYNIVTKDIIKNTKHSVELINYIKNLKKETTDINMAKIKIKEVFQKKISSKSILNYWV